MKRADDLPIEPLSEASWNRIERSLFEELEDRARNRAPATRERRPRWLLPALAAALVLQAVVGVVLLVRSGGDALTTARFVSGREASEATLGDVQIELEPSSALVVVESSEHGSLCVLERGAARFAVPHRGARPAFVVQAGEVRVEVVGTQFRVERAGGAAKVETYEGTVRVSAAGSTQLVARGQRWPVTAPAPSPSPAPAPAPAPALAPAPSPAPDHQRARFEQATAREASEPQQALRIYRALAEQDGPWAQNALYAAGRLELELGQRARAARTLRSYLTRHPAGANAQDARALLARIARETKGADR